MKRIATVSIILGLLTLACGVGDGGTGEQSEMVEPKQNERVADFLATAVYHDDQDKTFGVRWEHATNGMPVTILRIQSVPQVFLYVKTPPVSDRGEPHTGEHLLLGKGMKGKVLSASEGMSLIESTAYTTQTHVVYAWNCAAGKDTFYASVAQYLDALMLPNYTDEEVRREVCNLGVVVDEKTGTLSLDEKGTIYNEMVSSYQSRYSFLRTIVKRIYGEGHPLSNASGGRPAAVREMEPEHIHSFHRDHYHLSANLGMIVALPDTVPESEFLEHLSKTIVDLEATPELAKRPKKQHEIPSWEPTASRDLVVYPYPNANANDVGVIGYAWPAVAFNDQKQRVLSGLFLSVMASGQRATLYKRLLDGSTREVPLEASNMFGFIDENLNIGHTLLAVDGFVPGEDASDMIARVKAVIQDEISRIEGFEPGSEALAEFNQKALARLSEQQKATRNELNAPPLFGRRGAGNGWYPHLALVNLDKSGFRRSVTLSPLYNEIRTMLENGENPWKDVIKALRLDEEPYIGLSKPSPEMLQRLRKEQEARLAQNALELMEKYGVKDAQQAIARYKAEYDQATEVIAEAEKQLEKPKLVDDIPLVPDPSIVFEEVEVAGVTGHRGVFDNMTTTEVELYLRLDGVEPEHYKWLAILTPFLTSSGLMGEGGPEPYDAMLERRASEIFTLSASYSTRPERDRYELTLNAGGSDLAETKRALKWIGDSLHRPWIAKENLPRLRDLVKQGIRGLRGRLGGSAESWVRDPANAVTHQDDPLFLATDSIHARLFLLARCEWLLMDAPEGADSEAVSKALKEMAGLAGKDVTQTQANFEAFLKQHGGSDDEAMRLWIRPIAESVKSLVGDMAPGSLAKDLQTLTAVAGQDVAVSPEVALAEVNALRAGLLHRGDCRFILTGSRADMDALKPSLDTLLSTFSEGKRAVLRKDGIRLVDTRLRDHERSTLKPVHYGLVFGQGTSGVFLHSAGMPDMTNLDDASLIDTLAGQVYSGGGPHAFFMQTWGAGLAYSNGMRVRSRDGRVTYYAERCPDMVATMKFVTGLLKDSVSLDDPYMAEYSVALAMDINHQNDRYESRTRIKANAEVDGQGDALYRNFRQAVLRLRERPDLWDAMKSRIIATSGRALPGVGPKSRDVENGVFVTIAPERLLAEWEAWIKREEGDDEVVFRIYPRDFWMVPETPAG